jgi:N-acetylglucosaminyl-diphospho-decaprenol L-rhamnosyltransferase
MPARGSLIVVNYRTALLAIDAVRSARAATRAPLQVVIVDNSVDAGEADALRPHADVLIAAETNLGYGAAINRARRQCDGEVLIAANPDVRFGAGSIDRLLETDADVAGPALYWDDAFRWILPPSDLHTTFEVLDAAIASRSAAWHRGRDRRRIRKRIDFWSLHKPTPVAAISGAVMAIRPTAFDRLGGFDERFHLYFEEIDFQRRLGKGIVYVPSSHCRHIYNQSAGVSPEAAHDYARSEQLYLAKWSRLALAARRLRRGVGSPAGADRLRAGPTFEIDRDGVLVEASPLASFETAAGHFPDSRTVSIPPEVWESYRGDALYLRVVDLHSREVVGTWAKARML